MANDWSREEVEATVADYLAMLSAELRSLPYKKTDHRRDLLPLLTGRSEGSIEFKYQNISAALIRIGFPYVAGYKPRWNYQRQLLDEIVSAQLAFNPTLLALAQADAERFVPVPTVEDILKALTEPPKPALPRDRAREPASVYPSRSTNYLEREARNRELGFSGEQFVINFERARLISLKRDTLASKIEHVSKVRGDLEGFDVLSFEISGEHRLIEVKTTKYGRETPFFVTRNELHISQTRSTQYQVYRVFAFGPAPQLFMLKGAITSTCVLNPATYVATVGPS